MRGVGAWLIGAVDCLVALYLCWILIADVSMIPFPTDLLMVGERLLSAAVALAALGACACVALRNPKAWVFQRSLAWGLVFLYAWACVEDYAGGETRSVLEWDWSLLVWGGVAGGTYLASALLRRVESRRGLPGPEVWRASGAGESDVWPPAPAPRGGAARGESGDSRTA